MQHNERLGVCLVGAGGRMGGRVCRLLLGSDRFYLASALERPGTTLSPADLGIAAPADAEAGTSVLITDDAQQAIRAARIVIDFAAPPATSTLAPVCAEHGVAYLVASTALTPADEAALEAASTRCAVLRAANLSLGVNVMLELVERAARSLGTSFDIEISEVHHRHKRDAPSGTALLLGQAVERGRGGLRSVFSRGGVDALRKPDELGYSVLRGGDVAGEHTVYYFGDTERIEITHRAGSSEVFARGALFAAAWLVARPAGRYTMRDVLAEAVDRSSEP